MGVVVRFWVHLKTWKYQKQTNLPYSDQAFQRPRPLWIMNYRPNQPSKRLFMYPCGGYPRSQTLFVSHNEIIINICQPSCLFKEMEWAIWQACSRLELPESLFQEIAHCLLQPLPVGLSIPLRYSPVSFHHLPFPFFYSHFLQKIVISLPFGIGKILKELVPENSLPKLENLKEWMWKSRSGLDVRGRDTSEQGNVGGLSEWEGMEVYHCGRKWKFNKRLSICPSEGGFPNVFFFYFVLTADQHI